MRVPAHRTLELLPPSSQSGAASALWQARLRDASSRAWVSLRSRTCTSTASPNRHRAPHLAVLWLLLLLLLRPGSSAAVSPAPWSNVYGAWPSVCPAIPIRGLNQPGALDSCLQVRIIKRALMSQATPG